MREASGRGAGRWHRRRTSCARSPLARGLYVLLIAPFDPVSVRCCCSCLDLLPAPFARDPSALARAPNPAPAAVSPSNAGSVRPSARPTSAALADPRPTRISAATIRRTIWRRKASPTTSMVISLPLRRTHNAVHRPNRLPIPAPKGREVVLADETRAPPSPSPPCRAARARRARSARETGLVVHSRSGSGIRDTWPGSVAGSRAPTSCNRPIAMSAGSSPSSARLELVAAQPSAVGECDHLAVRMDTGVGSARAVHSHPAAGRQPGQRSFQLALHRPDSRLNLEAGKVGPVILDPRAVTNGAALSGDLHCGRPQRASRCSLDQLELDHGCRITGSRTELDDARIARGAVCRTWARSR